MTLRSLLTLCLVLMMMWVAQPVAAATGEIVIVTSFPKELFETYKKAFEASRPGVKVVIK